MSEPTRAIATEEDEALEALRRGDRDAALTLLMRVYGKPLFRYCYRLLSDRDRAQDAHQRAFVEAYIGFDAFRGSSSLKTWLYGIARHRCLDAMRAERRRERRLLPLEELSRNSEAPGDPEEDVIASDLRGALQECLDRLAPAARAAVLLRYQESFSYVEMADICGERPATLQARVARALPHLRRCLEDLGLRS